VVLFQVSHEFFPVPKRSSRAPLSDPWPILWGSRSFKRGCAVICELSYESQSTVADVDMDVDMNMNMDMDGRCGGCHHATKIRARVPYLPETRKQGQGGVAAATATPCKRPWKAQRAGALLAASA
jgi:hypothetical protein